MIPACNFHTHTTYCDGTGTPREIVRAALAQGLTGLGFSGHSYTAFDGSYCMSRAATAAYIAEIRALQAEYRERLPIFLGVEQDFCAEPTTFSYDFCLGGVHYVEKDGGRWDVDGSRAEQKQVVDRLYGGDYYAYARDYFRQVSALPERTGCQVTAHLDLLTKFNEAGDLFDENDPRYLEAAFGAIEALCDKGQIFEINTGAISRGYRSTPYPARPLLEEIYRQGGRIMLGSDSHRADTLLFGFELAADWAESCGFRSVTILDDRGFREVGL